MTAQEFWNVVEVYLSKNGLNRLRPLPAGVSEEELKSAEREMRVRLPRVFANFYRIHDGLEGWEFHYIDEDSDLNVVSRIILTMKVTVESWKFQCKLGREATAKWGTPAELNVSPWEQSIEWVAQERTDGFSPRTFGVMSEHWHSGWVPFAHSGSGDCTFLDLAADEGGHNGQIVDWWHENSMTRLAANSFADWLEAIANGLLDGSMTMTPI